MGALRTSMATCGYEDIAEFNRAELMVAPALQTEGKQLQRDQASAWAPRGARRGRPVADDASRRRRSAREPGDAAALARRARPACAATSRARGARAPERARRDEVVVLDFGGQYSQLIARRVRECGVFSELLPHHVGAEEVARAPKGLILSGGPASVYADGAPRLDPSCSSSASRCSASATACRLMALELGGRVEGAEVGEFGRSS
jgi:hypothetical protein